MRLEALRNLSIGWATGGYSLQQPSHRRKLLYYAKVRGLRFEIAENVEKAYDVVFVSLGADVTQWARYRKGKVIFDLSDALLHEAQRLTPKVALRGLAKWVTRQHRFLRLSYTQALKAMLRRADAVFCSTEEEKRLIEAVNGNVHILLDFHTDDVTVVKSSYAAGEPFNLVWEGLTPPSGFQSVMSVFETMKRRRPFALHLITDIKSGRFLNTYLPVHTKDTMEKLFPFEDVYLYEWNRHLFSRIATGCDLGVIPIPMDKPFWVGKPANKLLLLWRMGIPVLTSATPAYIKVMHECGLDMTCASLEEWESKLELYMTDESARREAGLRAKAFAEAEYGEEKLLARWDEMLGSILE